MLKQYDLPNCPVEVTLQLIGDRWKILILRELLSGTKRFGELGKGLDGISNKVLTQHLKLMADNGLIERKAFPEVPPRVEYSLTPLGESLRPVVDSMWVWGENYKESIA